MTITIIQGLFITMTIYVYITTSYTIQMLMMFIN